MIRSPVRPHRPVVARQLRNMAEPSGELSVGDVVDAGEVPLAVARTSWTRLRGGLNEVYAAGHGNPPAAGARRARQPLSDSTAKKHRDERP